MLREYLSRVVHAQGIGGTVSHYRDNTGLEVDAIVSDSSGAWAAFEVKLAEGRIDQAAESLRRLAAKVDTARMGDPACLGVITAGRYGYVRPDGVSVIPIGALGP